MEKVFFDTDIVLDFLLGREPFFDEALDVMFLAEDRQIKGFVSAFSFSNIFYILSRLENPKLALRTLYKLRSIVNVGPVSEKLVDSALLSDFKDFEDALQYYSAQKLAVSCILTRNKKDYAKSQIPILSAREYLIQKKLV